MKPLSTSFAVLCFATMPLIACGSNDSSPEEDKLDPAFAESIPDYQMLELSLDEESTTTSGTFGKTQQALVGQQAPLHEHSKQVMAKLNELLKTTHDRMDSMRENAPSGGFSAGALTCRQWEADSDELHWRLRSCERDRVAKRFDFVLHARPADATDDASYKVIVAGDARSLPRFQEARRGHGRIGYDFDNLAALKGGGVSGKLGIGFRAAGRVRQLNIAAKDFQSEGELSPAAALYRFNHIKEKGGMFKLLLHADYLTQEEDRLVGGADGVAERGRAVVVWRRGLGARAASVTCGGTLGEGTCIRMHQCWKRGGEVTFEEYTADFKAAPSWDESACIPEPPYPTDPPTEEELQIPASVDGEVQAPAPEEPPASSEE